MILKVLSFLLALFLASSALCQDEIIVKKIAKEHWKINHSSEYDSLYLVYLGLSPIENSSFYYHSRINSEYFYIELYGNHRDSLTGFALRYYRELTESFNRHDRKHTICKTIYCKKERLAASELKYLFDCVYTDTAQISNDSTKGLFYFALDKKIGNSRYKDFYPKFNFLDTNFITINTKGISDFTKNKYLSLDFDDQLPHGATYSMGNMQVSISSEKGVKDFRLKWAYNDSIKPIFDSFLVDQIDSLGPLDKKISLIRPIKFYPSGRVRIHAWNSTQYRDYSLGRLYEVYFEDWSLKRQVKKYLRQIDIKSFGLKYPQYRNLSTFEGIRIN